MSDQRKVVCPTCGTQELRRMDWTTMSGLCENRHVVMWDGCKAEWYNPNQEASHG